MLSNRRSYTVAVRVIVRCSEIVYSCAKSNPGYGASDFHAKEASTAKQICHISALLYAKLLDLDTFINHAPLLKNDHDTLGQRCL